MKTVTMNLKMKVRQHHHRRKIKRNLGIRSVQIRKEIQAEVGQVDVHEAEEGPGQGLEVDQEVLGDPQEDGVELQADLGIGADQSDRLRGEEVDHVIDLEGAVERPAEHVVDRQVVVETKRLIDHAAGLEEEADLQGGLGHVEEAELPNGLVIEAGHQVDNGVNQKKEASHQNVLKADVDLHQNRRSARRHQKRKRKKKKNLLLRRRRKKKKKSQRKRRKRERKRLKRRKKMTKRTPGRPTNMMKKKKKKGKRKKSKECRLSQNRIQRIVLSSGKSRERLETSHTMKSKLCFNRSVNF